MCSIVREIAPRYVASVESLVALCGFRIAPASIDGSVLDDPRDPAAVTDVFTGTTEALAATHHAKGMRPFEELPSHERGPYMVLSRLTSKIAHAGRKGLCAYCWLPPAGCFCNRLLRFSNEPLSATCGATADKLGDLAEYIPGPLLHRIRTNLCEVVVALHANEFMRQSNTGHILGMLLDAPMLVWGLPQHDKYWVEYGTVLERQFGSGTPQVTAGVEKPPVTYLLYPCDYSVGVKDVTESGLSSATLAKHEELANAAAAPPAIERSATMPMDEAINTNPLTRIVISDGTWSEASTLNRHFHKAVPRLQIDVEEDYESLFAPLRKRTRETGVSSMEATTMTLSQFMQAAGLQGEATVMNEVLNGAMKAHVDMQLVQKCQKPVYNPESGQELRDAINASHKTIYRNVHNFKKDFDRMEINDRMPSPVLSYCYVCDQHVGWARMDQHTRGEHHVKNVGGRTLMGAWWPSEFSRTNPRMLNPDKELTLEERESREEEASVKESEA